MKSEIKDWDKLPGESSAAYEAFKLYLESSDRSLQKVAESLHKTRQAVSKQAAKFDWKTRAAAYDSSIVESERQFKIKRRKMELEKQHELGLLMADKALKGLKSLDEKKISPHAVTEMAVAAAQMLNSVAELESAADSANKVTSITIKRAGD